MLHSRLILAFTAFVVLTSSAFSAQYFETSFEADQGYLEGPLTDPDLPWKVVTGTPSVIAGKAREGSQSLHLTGAEPIGRLRLQSRTLAAAAIVYVDCWVRPPASSDDAEILDFDGALVSFRRSGDEGEFSIFHATTGTTGHWITTGQRFPLDDRGQSRDWIRVTILRDYTTGSWHLWLDGIIAFQNVRALPTDDPEARAVWIVGNEFTSLEVDDFYFGAINPFALRPENGSAATAASPVIRSFPQTVGPKSNPTRSTLATEILDRPGFLTEPTLRGYSFEGKQGDEINIPKRVVNFLDDPDKHRITAFAPRYDDEGNPLPMEITFTADVELRPGADLRRIFWNVRRLPKNFDPHVDGDLLLRGNFDGNLARVVTVPGEDVRKGLSVSVSVE